MKKYTALIFDLGKVIFDVSFENIFKFWANVSNQQFDDLKTQFQFDDTFNQFERNDISPEQFRKIVSEQLSMQLSDEEFDEGWCSLYLEPYNGIEKLLVNLKYDYRLVALTNTNVIHNNIWRLKYADILKHFEKIFSSHELQTRKPEKKIYKIVLDYLQCQPEETVFLDDNIDNINGAKKLGISSILVESQEQMKMELYSLGLT